MAVRTVLVCEAQVPLVEGGAESHVRQLAHHLRLRGYVAGIVSVPFKWYPKQEILAHAAAWRLLDLSESNGQRIDLVIGTKFPSYFVRHPNKVTWLLHQYRAAYELCGTPFGDFDYTEEDLGLREQIFRLDREMLLESKRIYSNARNTANRLEKYIGVSAEPLYHPPRLADRLHCGEFGDYILSVGRIESIKRVDLAIRALRHVDPGVRLLVVGEGTQRENVERVAEEEGVRDRVQFLGSRSDDALVELYAGALGVVYAPFDEDYGYVTLEAFWSGKPVVTASDSGGVLEFVEDGVNGFVCAPDAGDVARAVNALAASRVRAASLGAAGRERVLTITWDGVIQKLVGGQ
ncbi:MAG TPA: glycosyltransferase family 4 protein [Vicinamibacterales bacterium]|jgi:glycosyltransferase involved in cell wall biosynthesis